MNPADIKRIAEAARGHGETILARWLPGGKRQGKEYIVRNPHRDDQHAGSLSVEIASGKGGDFATGETFGDYVGLAAFAAGIGMSEAAASLAEFLRLPPPGAIQTSPIATKVKPGWQVIMPVPGDAPAPPDAHYKLGKPDTTYIYRDGDGRGLGRVCRWNATTTRRKEFHPLTWCEDAAGRHEWRWQSWPLPRPLYGLDAVADRPDALIFVHEGEKSAEAGWELLPDAVSVCWPNGAGAADKADFGPLAGRDVVLWPDHDEPGTKAALTAAKAIRKADAKSVRFVNLDRLEKHAINRQGQIVSRLAPLPEGWDCADALAEGWTPQAIEELLGRDGALLDALPGGPGDSTVEPPKEATAPDERHADGPYYLDDELGLLYIETDREGKVRQSRVCAPCKVVALARDAEGGAWSPVIEFRDRDGQQRREVIPFRLFVGDGHDGVKQLVDLGLEVGSGRPALDRLKAYIVASRPERRARLADQTGWHGRAFLLPESAIGETDETLLFRGNRSALGTYATRGKLVDWQADIAHKAIGNPRLMFTLSVGFAGPFLKVLGMTGAAFHFVGDSSTGKSAALIAAGSIWGNSNAQVHSWRATSNALEYVAAQHNDALLILDELREVDPKEAGQITYMLTNAKGKGRAHHAGGLRETTTWRIVMLSSGELGLGDHLAGAGQKHYAGQEVRFIEIDADAGAGHGMWSDVSGCAGGGKQFSDDLRKFAARHHGTAGRAFLAELVKQIDLVPTWWRYHEGEFTKRYKPQDAGGQVLRVMSAFCLVAFAGEIASKFEIVPWPRGAATAVAGLLFEQWVQARPTHGNSEESKIIAHVRGVMERNWQSRFIDWDRASGTPRVLEVLEKGDFDPDLSRMPAVHDALGFRRPDMPFSRDDPEYLFYVTRSRFAEEFAVKGGFKPKRVAAVLKKHGALRCDDDGTTWRETLPNGDPRSYCIIGRKLWALET